MKEKEEMRMKDSERVNKEICLWIAWKQPANFCRAAWFALTYLSLEEESERKGGRGREAGIK